MTPFPHSIDAGASLEEARTLFLLHGFRHLPVRQGTELVGVISDRDLRRSLEPVETSFRRIRVADVMTAGPYCVDIHEDLDRVLAEMAARHIGCALVMKEGRLAGIFTTTDACRVFAEHLRGLMPPEGDGAA